MGSAHPVRVQSMTTTDTMDTQRTVAQILRLYEQGSTYVRLTVPSLKVAKNLWVIRDMLDKKRVRVPLVADIHFTPHAAEEAARVVEKVRVNPGNYVEKKIARLVAAGEPYENVLEEVATHFIPLLNLCKAHGTALRIGTNHGSLSKRMLFRYGNTPLGMVESALEYLKICHAENYQAVVVSMKASQPQLMLEAYRLLVDRLVEESLPPYPLHLGVTEAGDGEDGRVKSALGIGALLAEGIGDTVRVSLTEPPENELPVARAIIRAAQMPAVSNKEVVLDGGDVRVEKTDALLGKVCNVGADELPRVVTDARPLVREGAWQTVASCRSVLALLGHQYRPALDKWVLKDQACDYLYTGETPCTFPLPPCLYEVVDYTTWKILPPAKQRLPLVEDAAYFLVRRTHKKTPIFLRLEATRAYEDSPLLAALKEDKEVVLVLYSGCASSYLIFRRAMTWLRARGIGAPIILQKNLVGTIEEENIVCASLDVGGNLMGDIGQGVWLGTSVSEAVAPAQRVAFGILQATRRRISKTEYIACPSCGRTLFDLEEVTEKIRHRTHHLKGLKIGIMGCIVNGPGEMADADYGYVGAGKGKITLYRGKEIVMRAIPSEQAVVALIDLIKADNKWVPPPKEDALT